MVSCLMGDSTALASAIVRCCLNHPGVFGFKFTRLVLSPDKSGKLGNRGLRIEAVDIANFSDDTGGVDLADAWNGGQGVWDNLKLLFNGLVQNLDLFL